MRAYVLAPVVLAAALTATACSSSKSNNSSGGGGSPSSAVTITVKAGHLVGPGGKTLYYNTVDTSSNISCTGSCTSIWPPLLGTPKAGAGLNGADFTTITRPDGGRQVAFAGHPLYEFSSDTSGTTMGSGLTDSGGKWIVAPQTMASGGGASSSDSMTNSSSGGGSGY